MAKVALLIGVSEYEPGLNNLPAAVKDIAAMQRVLQDPEMGGFEQVKLLPNPDPQAMQYEIETLFSGRSKDDLVVLFFSGHGIKDDSGRLYFATRITRKNDKGDLIRATAVPTSFVHDIMNTSRCKRQAIILDCCFSGAFDPRLQAKDDGSVDLRSQLGAEGRVVLASSSSTEYSFEQQGSDLSLYTRYLVEGIETGAGDRNEDGFVSVLELHEYAASKVQETAPKMTPKIITLKDKGFEIVLAKARVTDPKLRYRKAASRYANAGSIRPAGRAYLNSLREQLGLSAEETTAIETEVLRPYQERLKNLQNYREALVAEAEYEYPLSEEACEEMNRLQELWGLRDEDILPIQQGVEAQFFQKSSVYQQHLADYGQAFTDAIQQGFPFSPQARQDLETLQRSLALRPEDAARIEQPLLQQAELKHQEQLRQVEEEKRQQQEQAEYENKLRRYEQEFTKAVQADYPLNQFVLAGLKTFQQELKLKDEDVDRIEQPIRKPLEKKYQEGLKQQALAEKQRQTELEQERQAAEYKQKLQRYKQEFTKAIAAQYPIDPFVRDELTKFQQSLELIDEDVAHIEAPLVASKEAAYQQRLADEQRKKEAAAKQRQAEEQERQQEEAKQQQQAELEKNRKAEYEDTLRRYEREFSEEIQAEYPLSQRSQDALKNYQQKLGLKDEDVARIEQSIREPLETKEYKQKLQRYEQEFTRVSHSEFPLSKPVCERLNTLKFNLELTDEDVKPIIERRIAEYQQQQLERQQQEFASDKGVDYSRLRDLLKAGQWKEADKETGQIMLRVAGQEKQGYLESNDIEQFPCIDLCTIDQLWVKYSDGRFGFSMQKKIWEEVGQNFEKFWQQLGWRRQGENVLWGVDYGELTFSLSAPKGHLPFGGGIGVVLLVWGAPGILEWRAQESSLASRLRKCNL